MKLRYIEYYGDGDTKSFSSVEKVYTGINVNKKECIGHVQKRMGTRLRKLVKENKGLGGTGKLNNHMIDKLQNYYGISIRRNVGTDVATMKTAVWAGFYHAISSPTKNWHAHCPKGSDSWCGFQSDIANNTAYYKPGVGLHGSFIPHVKPILEDLTNDTLLENCLHGKTQNQNESFNGTIWNRVPKDTYVGLRQFELGIYDAVSHFNIGNQATVEIYKKLGMTCDINVLRGLNEGNITRIMNANRKSTEGAKQKRRIARGLKKKKKDTNATKEGKTYAAGGF